LVYEIKLFRTIIKKESNMEWTQFAIFSISVFGLFLWNRSESRSDLRQFESEIRSWKEEINKEMKDFHGRLCSLEEKYLKDKKS